ncbi:NAD(P)-binding protein [Paeniglutamicibacter kerguelensis]|uniref:NAD(P)-binding protein n=1 Tax=Paeniglutamicibacter kerguelensis TaxID=254788 RepID=UPI003CCA66A1
MDRTGGRRQEWASRRTRNSRAAPPGFPGPGRSDGARRDMKALVAGAGLAGLVAARQLGLAGWEVEVLEKAAAPPSNRAHAARKPRPLPWANQCRTNRSRSVPHWNPPGWTRDPSTCKTR